MSELTLAQQRAVEEAGNIAVSAAAGSGKTSVLTRRVLRLLTSGADIDELLVVTFSNAAAAEMKSRIQRMLEERNDAQSLDTVMRMRTADICTLHSFCLKVIRENYEAAGVSPGVRVLSDYEARLLRAQTASALTDELYAEHDEDFARLIRAFCGRDDRAMKNFLLELSDLVATQGEEDFLERKLSELSSKKRIEDIYHTLCADCGERLLHARDCFSFVARVAERFAGDEYASSHYENAVIVQELFKAFLRSPAEFKLKYDGCKLANAKWKGMGEWLERCLKKAHNEAKAELKYVAGCEAVYDFEERYGRDLAATEGSVSQMIDLYERFAQRYAEEKRERGVLDFSDFEKKALLALSRPEVLASYTERLKYVFVDECQDLNPVQYRLINLLSQNAELFMVGDIKQAIYRFRHADPALFRGRLSELGSGAGSVIRMNDNFRSGGRIIGFINALMSRVFSVRTGGTDYGMEERMTAASAVRDNSVELLIAERGETPLSLISCEAAAVADRIEEFIREGYVWDARENRKRRIGYGDIAILLRETANAGLEFAAVLRARGIPVTTDNDSGAEDAQVSAFLSLLKVLDGGGDMDFAAVLRAMLKLCASELAQIRVEDKSASLMEAARRYAEAREDELSQKLKSLFSMIDDYRQRLTVYPFADFLIYLRETAGYELFLLSSRNGAEKAGALHSLIEGSLALTPASLESLSSYLYTVEEMRAAGALSKLMARSESAQSVRIMTIHKSKGLEFPVVFFSGLNKNFNRQEKREHMLLSPDYGIVVSRVELSRRVRTSTVIKDAALMRSEEDSLSEEIRLAYVAMTRARDHLVLSAGVRCLSDMIPRYTLPKSAALRAGNYLELLMPGLMAMRINGKLADYIPAFVLHDADYTLDTRVVSPAEREAEEEAPPSEEELLGAEPLPRREYPFADCLGVPAKCTVTGLAEKGRTFTPAFHSEEGDGDPLRRGTAVHEILSRLDFTKTAAAQGLTPGGYLTPRDIGDIDALIASPLGRRIAASSTVLREQPFCLSLPAADVGLPGRDDVVVQGIIDLCFLEEGRFVVVDYKTDRVDAAGAAERAQGYAAQARLYSRALHEITGLPAEERYIYFLRAGAVAVK